jgi:hypothetical protein
VAGRRAGPSGNSPGPSIDAAGVSVEDPTTNVNALVAQSEKLAEVRFAWAKEVADLRAMYTEKLANKESERIDAIRAVDAGAVQLANERANSQATVLATQVSTSAETLRTLVATTATATATAQQQLIAPISSRVSALELSQAQGLGRSAVADPAFSELLTQVKELSAKRSEGTGRVELFGWGMAVLMAIFAGLELFIHR